MAAGESTPPDIVLVVARAENGVIGMNGEMPWRLPADLRRFKRITLGKPVIMGRKTFESIGRPLPGRRNIVLTRRAGWQADGVTAVPTLAAAIDAARADGAAEIMVIGGAEIYALALPVARRIELTEIHVAPEGDTHFPPLDAAQWRETQRERHAANGDSPAHDFVTLERL